VLYILGMSRIRTAALAAVPALVTALMPIAASSQVCFSPFGACRDPFADPFNQNADRQGTLFDLGVDVSNVPLTRADVGQFLATLSPDGQRIMLKTCQNYLGDPRQVTSVRTIEFCRVVLAR
jgi:hypothetical protein